MRCFFCENISEKHITPDLLPKDEQHHIFRVIRAKPGEKIMLIDGRGTRAETILEKDKSFTVLNIEKCPAPNIRLHLFTAPPRRQKIDRMLEQCSEIGITSVTLLKTERSISAPEKKSAVTRMKKHLIEGCKQAHNPFLPELNPELLSLNTALEKTANFAGRFYGAVSDGNSKYPENIEGDAAWFVGPEGGFTQQEEETMRNTGILPLKLGPWVMRIETAAVIGAYRIMNY